MVFAASFLRFSFSFLFYSKYNWSFSCERNQIYNNEMEGKSWSHVNIDNDIENANKSVYNNTTRRAFVSDFYEHHRQSFPTTWELNSGLFVLTTLNFHQKNLRRMNENVFSTIVVEIQ